MKKIINYLSVFTLVLFLSNCDKSSTESTVDPLVGVWKQIILEQYENINCNGTSIIFDFTSEALIETWGFENERVWTTDSDGTLTYVSSKIYSNGIIESETLIGTWEDKGGSLCIVLEGYDNNDTDDCVDCSGDPFGNAVYDKCGEECIAADSSADCSAYCDADSSNDCVQDCSGEWGGILEEDMCGTCDYDPENDCVLDCAGVWGGTREMDLFGACCTATEESPCIITGCDLPDSTVYLTETSMVFNSSKAIKQIKLTLEDSVIPSTPLLGSAGDAGFNWLGYSDSSNWVLGKNQGAGTLIPAGCGILFNTYDSFLFQW